ncbi:MAG: AAA family ATPase [Candidatus Aenigmarchaeota archaeon]|nr:AAA family ATPase [Candidatus Aenigmarchaeota archaeon]MCK5234470.1 AAA family ATPase [Candidatus Aenigmarchaeota archaeon]MCK5372816.1 AAA family ATPase [Candidatus Aenigmarchaeota archaeon]
MELINTGIKNLDKILGGGIPKGSLMLLVGPTGSGKSVLSSQFAASCISKYNLKCLYLSFEEHTDTLEKNFDNFTWKLDEPQKKKLKIIKYNPYEFSAVSDILSRTIKKDKIDIVIIDSLTGLELYVTEPKDLKNNLIDIQHILKENGCTAIITSQIPSDSYSMNRLGFEEALSDGVIMMYYKNIKVEHMRGISVWKMRNMKHDSDIYPYTIEKEGIKIHQKSIR